MPMPKDRRKHQRIPSTEKLRIHTSITSLTYTISLRDVSKGGAFIQTTQLPIPNETITFEIIDEYGLKMDSGRGEVIRIEDTTLELTSGFAVCFEKELEQAMLDYLCAVRIEK
jgi:hypothetical protein